MYFLEYDVEILTQLVGIALLKKYTYVKDDGFLIAEDFEVIFEGRSIGGLATTKLQTLLYHGTHLSINDRVVEESGELVADLFSSIEDYNTRVTR